MALEPPAFSIGIEEEYLLVDRETRDLIRELPPDVMATLRERLPGQVGEEFLRSQIEVQTKALGTLEEAAADLRHLRSTICEVADAHGLAPISASTHPFADWGKQLHTDKERYNMLAQDMAGVVRRLVICGMHVHVGIANEDLRIDLMNQVTYFLPHILALSTSSPFWQGDDTGLKSYRMAVFKSLPRTGLPEHFNSWAEYMRHVQVLVDAGIFEDASKLWWDVRPSARFPTLELRIPDICTTFQDGISIAALYLCLLGMLYRKREDNQRWRTYANLLVSENIWRAQRYGISDSLMDFGKGELVPVRELVDELIELVAPEAARFGCEADIEHLREIVRRGTSADRQLATYEKSLAENPDTRTALSKVVDFLIDETRAGL